MSEQGSLKENDDNLKNQQTNDEKLLKPKADENKPESDFEKASQQEQPQEAEHTKANSVAESSVETAALADKSSTLSKILFAVLGSCVISVYPLMFLLMRNFEIVPDKMAPLLEMGKLALISLAVLAVLTLIFRKISSAALCTFAAVLIFENGNAIQELFTKIFPSLRYWHTVTLLLIIFAVLVIFIKKLEEETGAGIVKVISLVFTILICINVVPALFTAKPKDTNEPVKKETAATDKSGRNIYWLLFDMYGSNDMLQKYLNYDNSDFTNALEEKGFNVSYSSKNETRHSPVIAANTANLDYVVAYSEDRTVAEDYSLVTEAQNNAILIPLVESHGYETIGIGYAHLYGFKGEEAIGENSGGLTNDGDDVITLFWKQTVISPFVTANVTQLAEVVLNELQYLQKRENIPKGNTFVLSHINSPHTPYLFQADGSMTDIASQTSMVKGYVPQLQFINSQILKIVDNIIENDPTALIAVMSDHDIKSADLTYEERCKIFAALYDNGEKVDIEGITGINMMITLLNKALNLNMEYVPHQYVGEVSLR